MKPTTKNLGFMTGMEFCVMPMDKNAGRQSVGFGVRDRSSKERAIRGNLSNSSYSRITTSKNPFSLEGELELILGASWLVPYLKAIISAVIFMIFYIVFFGETSTSDAAVNLNPIMKLFSWFAGLVIAMFLAIVLAVMPLALILAIPVYILSLIARYLKVGRGWADIIVGAFVCSPFIALKLLTGGQAINLGFNLLALVLSGAVGGYVFWHAQGYSR